MKFGSFCLKLGFLGGELHLVCGFFHILGFYEFIGGGESLCPFVRIPKCRMSFQDFVAFAVILCCTSETMLVKIILCKRGFFNDRVMWLINNLSIREVILILEEILIFYHSLMNYWCRIVVVDYSRVVYIRDVYYIVLDIVISVWNVVEIVVVYYYRIPKVIVV